MLLTSTTSKESLILSSRFFEYTHIELISSNLKFKKEVKSIAEGRRRALTLKHLRLAIAVFLVFLFILPVFIMRGNSSTISQTLYAHTEQTTIGGVNYYLHKLSSADGPATSLSVSAVSTGRKLVGRWVYPLNGILLVPASTWTVTYRAKTSGSASSVVAHNDVDILIRKSDNTIRTTIATNVANSPSLTLVNTWQTLTGTYSWTAYTVVDQTDYLEVAYYIEVTTSQSSKSVYLRVDDNTLALADQTKIENVMFAYPSQVPVASFTFSPSYPTIYETVTFNASASYDSDGNIVSYEWDFGDGNITTVTSSITTHIYTTAGSVVNYTVTLTVTDNEGSTASTTQIVPVTNPTILYVSLPAGTYVGPGPDHWLSQCWLLNITGLSETFTVRINNTHASWTSHDTHLIIALNDASYQYLNSLTVNTTAIPKTSFMYGTPTPYGFSLTWEEDVYPTWFSDTHVVGTIDPKGYKDVQVSVSFSNTTGVRMHFDAYGSRESTPPTSKGLVTHNPHEKDSTVLFWPPPVVKYRLTMATNFGTTSPSVGDEHWYEAGTVVPIQAFAPSVVPGERYVWLGWTGTGTISYTGMNNPASVTMNSPITETAAWRHEYRLTMATNFGTTSPSVGDEHWYEAGTVVPIQAFAPSVVPGERYVWNGWTGTGTGSYTGTANPSSVTMNGPISETASWAHQFLLTVNTNPAEVLTLNPAAVSGQGWYDSGSTATVDAVQNVDKVAGQSRYDFRSWTGATPGVGNKATVFMDGPKTATANYQLQYKITFNQSGVGSDFPGTVLTIDGTNYGVGDLPVSFWWDDGSSHTFAFQSPLVVTPNAKQYVLTSTTTGSVTGNYKTQYYLTVTSPYDKPTPTSGWVDAGSITASVTSPWPGPEGTRYVCTDWIGTGSVPPSGTAPTVTFTITQPSSIAWNWKTQYLLAVLTDPSGLSPQPTRNPAGEAGGSWWYDISTDVTLTAQTVTGYTFTNWDVDTTSQGNGVNPITVKMNAPHTATAHYTPIPPQPRVPVGGSSVALTKQTPTSSLIVAYAMLIALFSASLSLFRRKRKW